MSGKSQNDAVERAILAHGGPEWVPGNRPTPCRSRRQFGRDLMVLAVVGLVLLATMPWYGSQ